MKALVALVMLSSSAMAQPITHIDAVRVGDGTLLAKGAGLLRANGFQVGGIPVASWVPSDTQAILYCRPKTTVCKNMRWIPGTYSLTALRNRRVLDRIDVTITRQTPQADPVQSIKPLPLEY